MPRNDGMTSEKIFDAHFKRLGKKAYSYSFTDTRRLRAEGGKGFANSRPSDRIVTYLGETFYAEIKSTNDADKFSLSLIRPYQLGAAERQVNAGGKYYFFVHSIPRDCWFKIPAELVLQCEKRSIRFDHIKEHQWFPKLS